MSEYIPLAKCKAGHIYAIDSRNLTLGVFDPSKDNGFIGIRQKFGDEFLFTEHHWDNGEPYGTVKPLVELGPLPADLSLDERDDKLFAYLKGLTNPKGGSMRIAIFPGSFDPFTRGHLDIVKRAIILADYLIVGVGINPKKNPLFTPEERVRMIEESLKVEEMPFVRVKSFEGSTADFARHVRADIIVKGLRDGVDLHYETPQANINLAIGKIETTFLVVKPEFIQVSSTYVKELASLQKAGSVFEKADLLELVPEPVARMLQEKRLNG